MFVGRWIVVFRFLSGTLLFLSLGIYQDFVADGMYVVFIMRFTEDMRFTPFSVLKIPVCRLH